NMHMLHILKMMISKESRENLTVYQFEQNKKGNHKKVIIIDREKIIAGSSNFGYKSLVTSSDYEVNFVACSKELTKHTLEIFDADIDLSRDVTDQLTAWNDERLKAFLYQLGTPVWG
ncbi:MAG: phospholipase D-like domain-containing protein, partial [Simkaniaceae bacterium]|nr:phospholipase D-like domain-containing protein [Simkaniaceae bacterium]